jgi:hypothetical protein
VNVQPRRLSHRREPWRRPGDYFDALPPGYDAAASATTIERSLEFAEVISTSDCQAVAVNLDLRSADSIKKAFGRVLKA